jgi:hypothetical protein
LTGLADISNPSEDVLMCDPRVLQSDNKETDFYERNKKNLLF